MGGLELLLETSIAIFGLRAVRSPDLGSPGLVNTHRRHREHIGNPTALPVKLDFCPEDLHAPHTTEVSGSGSRRSPTRYYRHSLLVYLRCPTGPPGPPLVIRGCHRDINVGRVWVGAFRVLS